MAKNMKQDKPEFIYPSSSSYRNYVGMLDLYYSRNPVTRHIYRKRPVLAFKLSHISAQHNILEVGFGPGVMFPTMAHYASNVVGIELEKDLQFLSVKEMCKKEKVSHKVMLINCDARKMPFQDRVFDRVFALSVLEHIPELESALEEVARVLKTEGSFIISLPIETIIRKAFRKSSMRYVPLDFHNCEDIIVSLSKAFEVKKIQKYPPIFAMFLTLECQKRRK